MIFSSTEGGMLQKNLMVESLLFIGAEAGAGEKKPEPVKSRPAPQHWVPVPVTGTLSHANSFNRGGQIMIFEKWGEEG